MSDEFDSVVEHPFDDALSTRYLVYALSTITARSLPDLRDGLKPVQRRLLWAMRQLRLEPGNPYKKSASVVGEVIGKYHPHGNDSIYDAMVRLAQDFSLRYPLVDGQGNFGNIDGDNAAAFRYTEARLTAVAADLIAGLDEGMVDFRQSFSGEYEEPELMPGLFPNLLANGASGIAVGMATSIPPHNAAELIDAATILIDEPAATDAQLLEVVKGPDFPTGGVLVDNADTIALAYATGRGAFRVRARWSIEKGPQGSWTAVVTEIPYQVQKGKLIEQIAALIADRKLPILADIRDESDEKIRIVIEPRSRTVDADVLMESLFRLTDLEVRASLNLNVLDAMRTPRVLSLKEVLGQWVTFQLGVLVRRAQHRIGRINDRLELLEGYLIAFLNLDRVIGIIRTKDEPKPVMIDEFGLSDRQAEAILNMRLRSLRRLEEMQLKGERDTLTKEREGLQQLVDSPARQRTRLKKDLGALRAKYGPETALGARRTSLEEAAPAREIPLEAMIEREPITVILSKRGWIRAMRGHVETTNAEALKFKEGDSLAFPMLHAHTTDKLLLASSDGRFYTLAADKLPGGRGFGEPVKLMVDIEGEGNVVALLRAGAAEKLLVASSDGRGFLTSSAGAIAETRKGKQIVNLRPGQKLRVVRPLKPGDDYLAVVGENRKLVVYPLGELPEMGRGQGVQLQRYRDGGLADAKSYNAAEGLSWPMGGEGGRTRTEDMNPWRTARGAAGRMPPQGFPRDNRFD
jgi:topoisomerase-4 subunit A